MKPSKPKKNTASDRPKSWIDDPEQLPALVRRLESEHRPRFNENKAYLRRYWNRPVGSVDPLAPVRDLGAYDLIKQQVTGNLTREVVDASIAIVCREMAAEVLPKGADFELEQGCKTASRLIEGVFENSEFLSVATQGWRDGSTADVGVLKGVIEDGEIVFQRRDPMLVTWVDDGTDDPRTVVEAFPASRDALLGKYGEDEEKRKAILDATQWTPDRIAGVDPPGKRGDTTDTVKVLEAYASALDENNPGRHVVMLASGDILEDEPFTQTITPYVFCKWQDDYRGLAGVSLARIVAAYDNANRRLLRMVYAGLAGAVPQVLEHEDGDTEGPSDTEFGRWKWNGPVAPQIIIPQTVSGEVITRLDTNRQMAFAEGGVNQSMATGAAPAQYSSGAAQRQFVDIANTRLLPAQKMWERVWRRAAQVVVMLAAHADKIHVRIKGQNRYEAMTFPKLPRDKYRISFGLSSGLSLTPAARLQDLQDLKDAGVIDTPDVIRNLQLPDTRELADRVNACRDLALRQISQAMDHGQFDMPSELQGAEGLSAIVTIGGQEWQRATLDGIYPPAHLEVLRRLIKAAAARLQGMAPPPAPANDQTAAGAPPAQAQVAQ